MRTPIAVLLLATGFPLFSVNGAVTTTERVFTSEGRSVGTTDDQGLTSIVFESLTVTATDGLATFRIRFTATGSGPLNHNSGSQLAVGSDSDTNQMDASGESILFNGLTIVNFNAGGGILTESDIIDLSFTAVDFNAASGSDDSGSILGNIWTDINATPADFVGHDPASDSVNLELMQGGMGPTSFDVTWVSGAWRVNAVTVGFNVAPEPSRAVMIGLAGLLLGLRRRR